MGTTLPRSSRTDSSVVDLPAHRQHGGARPCTRQTPAHSPTSQRWGAVRGEERRGTWLASRWARLADGTLSLGSGRNGAHSLSPGKCCNRCCPFIASRGLHRPCRCRPHYPGYCVLSRFQRVNRPFTVKLVVAQMSRQTRLRAQTVPVRMSRLHTMRADGFLA
jgi:hypothetical protein